MNEPSGRAVNVHAVSTSV